MTQNAVMPDEERELVLEATAGRLQEKARVRRQMRCYLIAIITLGVFTATLAVVNVTLSRRASQPVVASAPSATPATPPAAATPTPAPETQPARTLAAATPAPPAPAPPVAAPAPAAPVPPAAARPAPPAFAASPAPVAAVTSNEPVVKAPKPATAVKPAAVVAPKSDASPVKRAVTARGESRLAHATEIQPMARGKMEPRTSDAPDSSLRVARWLVATYGKRDAERQAAQAVSYYPAGDERTEHWRKVLAHVRTATDQ